MPIMFPAPGLFSTKKGCPIALEKCCASTLATMSVPPPGGDGTTMRTGPAGDSPCPQAFSAKKTPANKSLTHCIEPPSAPLHGPGRNQHEGDNAGLGAAIDPVV